MLTRLVLEAAVDNSADHILRRHGVAPELANNIQGAALRIAQAADGP